MNSPLLLEGLGMPVKRIFDARGTESTDISSFVTLEVIGHAVLWPLSSSHNRKLPNRRQNTSSIQFHSLGSKNSTAISLPHAFTLNTLQSSQDNRRCLRPGPYCRRVAQNLVFYECMEYASTLLQELISVSSFPICSSTDLQVQERRRPS